MTMERAHAKLFAIIAAAPALANNKRPPTHALAVMTKGAYWH